MGNQEPTFFQKFKKKALERAIREDSSAIGVVRTAQEWLAHPVGRRLASKPVTVSGYVDAEGAVDGSPHASSGHFR